MHMKEKKMFSMLSNFVLVLHFQLFYSSVTNKSFENQSSGIHNFNRDIFENINIIRSGRFFLFLRFLRVINSMSKRAKIKQMLLTQLTVRFFYQIEVGNIHTRILRLMFL